MEWQDNTPLVELTTAPHPRGDVFLGRRLPEFELNWRAGGQTHPLRVIGRHVKCDTHSEFAPGVLSANSPAAPCLTLAQEWRETLAWQNVSNTGLPKILSTYRSQRAQEALRAVKATMVDEVRHLDGDLAGRRFEAVLRSPVMAGWAQHGEKMFEARDVEVSSSLWCRLLDDGLEDLPRRRNILGWIGVEEEFLAFWGTLPRLLPRPSTQSEGDLERWRGKVRKLVVTLDDLSDEVNVWGWFDEGFMRRAGLHDATGRPVGYEETIFDRLPAALTAANLRQWLHNALEAEQAADGRGLGWLKFSADYAESRWREDVAKAGLSMSTAEEWRQQGLLDPKRVVRAVDLMKVHPGLPPGRAAWYARHPHLNVQVQGFQPGRSQEPRRLNPPFDRGRTAVAWQRRIVPADWWQHVALPDLEGDGLGL